MIAKSINLIIKHEEESVLSKKLKIIFPAIAVVLLGIFVVIFFILLIYTNNNINQFNALKSEVVQLENKISDKKTTEGVYSWSAVLLKVLNQMTSNSKNLSVYINQFKEIKLNGINFVGSKTDNKGNVDINFTASNSASLYSFIEKLLQNEQNKKVSAINASGISRNKKGQYILTVSYKVDPSLLQ